VFNGYTLDAIARTLCDLFKIGLVVETDAARQVVADAKFERCETAWSFLERLCRLAGVLACDDAQGRLVLTRAGADRASGRLVQGDNIEHARGTLDVRKRFSNYIVKGQHGIGGGKGGGLDTSALVGPGPATAGKPTGSGKVVVGLHAEAIDKGVPRYRPHVSLAESQMTPALMQLRANWQRAYAYGRAIQAHITVTGFRQPDGSLWRINQLVSVVSPYLGIDMELLTTNVQHTLTNAGGRQTVISVGPVEGWTPDPGQVKLRKHGKGKGHKGTLDLSGLNP
jgi:prophage tail gpP-like protein